MNGVKMLTKFKNVDGVTFQETTIEGVYEIIEPEPLAHLDELVCVSKNWLGMLLQDSDALANMRALSNKPYRRTP